MGDVVNGVVRTFMVDTAAKSPPPQTHTALLRQDPFIFKASQ